MMLRVSSRPWTDRSPSTKRLQPSRANNVAVARPIPVIRQSAPQFIAAFHLPDAAPVTTAVPSLK